MGLGSHISGTHGTPLAVLHILNACILQRHVLGSNPLCRCMHNLPPPPQKENQTSVFILFAYFTFP